MRTRFSTLGLTLLMLTGFISSVSAKTQHLSCTFASTFADGVETHIDTNGDGVSAGLSQGIDNCNIGRFFIQLETEYVGPITPLTTCPQGTEEFHGVQNRSVWTEEKTSDQVLSEASVITLCLNPSLPDLPFSYTGKVTVIGGTGKFAGATGSIDIRGAGKYLVLGVKDNVFGGFGQFTEIGTGTLTLPGEKD